MDLSLQTVSNCRDRSLKIIQPKETFRLSTRNVILLYIFFSNLKLRDLTGKTSCRNLNIFSRIILLLLLLLLKPEAQAKVGKTKLFILAFATPQAPAPRKTEVNTTRGSNQRLTAPLYPSGVPVSNTVLGRSFHNRT